MKKKKPKFYVYYTFGIVFLLTGIVMLFLYPAGAFDALTTGVVLCGVTYILDMHYKGRL